MNKKLLTPKEWAGLSAESRHRLNTYFAESLQNSLPKMNNVAEELTLDAWCARLPMHYLVNRQLAELQEMAMGKK